MLKERFYYGVPMEIATMEHLVIDGKRFVAEKEIKRESLPRLTICGIWDTDTNMISFGAACCSENDRFVRRIGRNISRHRATNCPNKVVNVGDRKVPDVFMDTARELEIEIMTSSRPTHVCTQL